MGDRIFLRLKITQTENHRHQDRFPARGAVANLMIEGACDLIVRSKEKFWETIIDSLGV